MYGLWALPFVVCNSLFLWQCSLKGQRYHCGKIQFLWCLFVCRIFGQLKVMDIFFPCDLVFSFTILALLCRANMPIKLVCTCNVESVNFWKCFFISSLFQAGEGLGMWNCTHHSSSVEVREELAEIRSLFPPCGFQGSNSAHQAWWNTFTHWLKN